MIATSPQDAPLSHAALAEFLERDDVGLNRIGIHVGVIF
jgi:hypothetical protein